MAGSQSPPPAVDHDPSVTRSLLCGPSTPPPPYPVYLSGPVQKGFGRGSKELGCPTANLPDEAVDRAQREDGWGDENGVYFGYAKVGKRRREVGEEGVGDGVVRPMVMSVGWNPVYKNVKRTAEVHILHDFGHDFYGELLKVVVLGFIRPEYNYTSLDALIKDIDLDKQATLTSLDRPVYRAFARDPFFDD